MAVVATLLALSAHAAGGGSPHVGGVLPVAVLVAALGTRCASRRGDGVADLITTLSLLSASQVAMHVLFTVSHRGFEHGPPVPDLRFSSMGMVAAHAVAVVLTGLLVLHADTLLVQLRAALNAVVPRLVVAPPPSGPLVLAPARWRGGSRAHVVLLSRACPRRGPPRLS